MGILDEQPIDLALHFFIVGFRAHGNHVGQIADDGDVHIDLCRHAGANEVRLVFCADLQLSQIGRSIRTVEREADRNDHKCDEGRNQQ
ncbi:hypothetical protein AJ87_23240 [Rhizobium yanglingense]|nr:hypothetical protein AJ87_23240 [Rhizobium yanglingense]